MKYNVSLLVAGRPGRGLTTMFATRLTILPPEIQGAAPFPGCTPRQAAILNLNH